MAHVRLHIKGQERLRGALQSQHILLREQTMNAIEALGQEIMVESRDEIPVSTGTARDTAFVERHDDYVQIGYGGKYNLIHPRTKRSTAEYLVVLHESLKNRHEQGKAKFLEDPVRRRMTSIELDLAKKVK